MLNERRFLNPTRSKNDLGTKTVFKGAEKDKRCQIWLQLTGSSLFSHFKITRLYPEISRHKLGTHKVGRVIPMVNFVRISLGAVKRWSASGKRTSLYFSTNKINEKPFWSYTKTVTKLVVTVIFTNVTVFVYDQPFQYLSKKNLNCLLNFLWSATTADTEDMFKNIKSFRSTSDFCQRSKHNS